MKEVISNIKNQPVTTGAGIVGVILIIAKLLGYNVSALVGMSDSEIILYFGVTLQSILLLIGKDPEEVKQWVKNLFKKKNKKE